MNIWDREEQWIVFRAKELKDDPDFLLKKLYEKKFSEIIDNIKDEIMINTMEERKKDD